jgi:zinc transport system permease protein
MDAWVDLLHRLMNVLLPFAWAQPEFMRNAFLAVLFIAPASAMLGVHVTAFRMAFFSDAVSHSAFTGVALGFLLAIHPLLAMILFALVVGLSIIHIERKSNLAMDSIISVIMSLGVAVGLAIVSYKKSFLRELQPYLFGDILTITPDELLVLALVLVGTALYSVYAFNRLTLLGLHRHFAINRYRSAERDKVLFSLLLALVVAVSIKTIGILLITSLIVIPAATARLLARDLRSAFWIGIACCTVASLAGLILSYYADSSTGALIIILLAGLFFGAYLLRALRQGAQR